ncbi:MAG TPA: thiamine-phosphate kinase [Polyangiaceae bacterium]
MGEFQRIGRIQHLFSAMTGPYVQLGIGDDAAVLSCPRGGRLVWTIDSSVEDVHFRRDWLSEGDIGWRSFHAAVSDIAAMGAKPVGALSALELPAHLGDAPLQRLLQGQADAAVSLACPVIGGNLARSAKLTVTTTVLGRTQDRVLTRSGASVGDEIWLVGDVGLAAAGLSCLMSGRRLLRGSAVERCIAAWRRPVALIARGRALVGRASSAIDVSDGLVGDARHLAQASGVGIELDLDSIEGFMCPELHSVAETLASTALNWALYGGEDYALLATGQAAARPRWARRIGEIVEGRGVWGMSRHAVRQRLRTGFDHFAG